MLHLLDTNFDGVIDFKVSDHFLICADVLIRCRNSVTWHGAKLPDWLYRDNHCITKHTTTTKKHSTLTLCATSVESVQPERKSQDSFACSFRSTLPILQTRCFSSINEQRKIHLKLFYLID